MNNGRIGDYMKETEDYIQKYAKPVEQMDVEPSEAIVSMINNWNNTGFNAKRLARACKIYEAMIQDSDCVKYFALSGAMVPAGMQKIIYDFLDLGFIDVLVTTGANLTHDLAEALGDHHLQGFTTENTKSDADLHDDAMNRIYDVFMPNNIYENMEDWLKTLKLDVKTSVKEILWALGDELPEDSKSILKICAKKRIPIYCPAITDSGLGMQLSFIHPQFSPNSAKYVVQVTTDVQVSAGGLSSASLSEAISWGKVNPQGETSQVHLDATIALPIILAYLKQKQK